MTLAHPMFPEPIMRVTAPFIPEGTQTLVEVRPVEIDGEDTWSAYEITGKRSHVEAALHEIYSHVGDHGGEAHFYPPFRVAGVWRTRGAVRLSTTK